jgi:hypothetical protein
MWRRENRLHPPVSKEFEPRGRGARESGPKGLVESDVQRIPALCFLVKVAHPPLAHITGRGVGSRGLVGGPGFSSILRATSWKKVLRACGSRSRSAS